MKPRPALYIFPAVATGRSAERIHILVLSFRPKRRNGASGTSDMDGEAARAAVRESGNERVQSLDVSALSKHCYTEIFRDVSTLLDMTQRRRGLREIQLQ